tara:strand:+ start:183 stop:1361 length:1179 start_codon:yes stop_codon:yes gene_type:complete
MKYSVIIGKNKYPNIRYDINIGKERLRGSTIYNVNKIWVTSTNPLEIKKSLPAGQKRDARELRNNLEKFEDFIEDTTARLKSQNLHSIKSKLKEEIEIYFGRTSEQEEDKKHDLFSFMDEFILLSERRVRTVNGVVTKTTKGTISGYKRLKEILIDYKEYKGIALDYQNINDRFEVNFLEYLTDIKKFGINYKGKLIKNLKMFMNKANIDGHHNNLKFKNFKVLKESKLRDYLTESEMEVIFKGTKNPRQDYFLLMAYTGMRASEILPLRKDNIKGNYISFFESKNKKNRVFRITDRIQVVLDRWEGSFPNDTLRRKERKGDLNKYLESTIQHKTIRCHSGRRSFCTNEYLKGTPVEEIMFQSGHSTYAIFKTYVVATGIDILKAMNERRDL